MQDKNEVFWDVEDDYPIKPGPFTDAESRAAARDMGVAIAVEEARLLSALKYDPIIVDTEPSSLVGRIARNSMYGMRAGDMPLISAGTDVGKSVLIDSIRDSYLLEHNIPYTYPEMHWRPEDILNTEGPRGSSRKSESHAKKKRKAQTKSRRINRSK